jgi:uncharacterized membrane protein HdeD (DUF308 family)
VGGERAMRWGSAVAALCFALLAWFRFSDDRPALAALFAVAAVVQAFLTVRSFVDQRSQPTAPPVPSGRPQGGHRLPPKEQITRTLDVYRTRRRGWLRLAGAGWVLAGAGIFLFAPTAIALAAISLFATLRFRHYDRYVPLLERALAEHEC